MIRLGSDTTGNPGCVVPSPGRDIWGEPIDHRRERQRMARLAEQRRREAEQRGKTIDVTG